MTKATDTVTALRSALRRAGLHLLVFFKWLFVAVVVGSVVGLVCTLFYHALSAATALREQYSFLLYLLPFGGLLIVFLYRMSRTPEPRGTNLVIGAVRTGESIPLKMTPLIFAGTVFTHLFGGSAGREGAALQLGGSLGDFFGRLFRFSSTERNLVVMCGMSAGFSALFGTPVAAAVFAMELISIGVMYYAALVPCAVSSFVAILLAGHFGVKPERFSLAALPASDLPNLGRVLLLAALCAGVSILFCLLLHQTERGLRRLFQNSYLRIFAGGCAVVLLTLLLGTRDYLGAGLPLIERAVEGEVRPEAFLLKMGFTALTLAAGYKGGEIVPTFFIGATFGCFVGPFLGLDPGFSAAIGMVSLFCGVTNCPLTALLLAVELFGFSSPLLFLTAIAVSYMLSGYYSLYSAQRILYSKTEAEYVNRETK